MSEPSTPRRDPPRDHDATLIKIVTILTLGVILFAGVIGLTVVAIVTDRDLWRAEILLAGGAVILAALGGISWWQIRRRRWHVEVDREGGALGE